MKLKVAFDKRRFRQAVLNKMDRIDKAIISRLTYVGEQFVATARLNGTYQDRTGNLRSSIGYLVLKRGKVVSISSFESSNNNSGAITGKKFILELSEKFPAGYVLICAAGMEYAAAVESRGKDVITGSSGLAENKVKVALANLLANLRG